MSSHLKAFLQYLFILLLTGLLVWFSLRGLQAEEGENKWIYLKRTWDSADKGWLGIVAALAFISHFIRAKRWSMLLAAAGNGVKVSYSFYSLMVGYLVNLIIPRGGEVSRCYNLYKLQKTPLDVSFGTVVVERIVDVICLLLLLALSFAVESQKLLAFIDTLPISLRGSRPRLIIFVFLAVAVLVLLLAIFIAKRNQKFRLFLVKTWTGFRQGLRSAFALKEKWQFIAYSILIWVFYYVMSYSVIMAFPSTSELGFDAVLSLFAIGAIAMAVPLPGGTGSYHVLVPQGLVFLYAIRSSDAVAFTFIFHGWQTFIMIVAGAASLLITSFIVKRNSKRL